MLVLPSSYLKWLESTAESNQSETIIFTSKSQIDRSWIFIGPLWSSVLSINLLCKRFFSLFMHKFTKVQIKINKASSLNNRWNTWCHISLCLASYLRFLLLDPWITLFRMYCTFKYFLHTWCHISLCLTRYLQCLLLVPWISLFRLSCTFKYFLQTQHKRDPPEILNSIQLTFCLPMAFTFLWGVSEIGRCNGSRN